MVQIMEQLIAAVEELGFVEGENAVALSFTDNNIIFADSRSELVPEQCVGCDRASGLLVCSLYSGKEKVQHSRVGGCAGRTHNRVLKNTETEFKLNPLKASKRSQKGK